MLQWKLSPTSSRDLRKTLAETHTELQGDSFPLKRSLNSNTIVLDYEVESGEALQYRAELISRYNPGKIFYFLRSTPIELPVGTISNEAFLAGGIVKKKIGEKSLFTECVFGSLTHLSVDALASVVNGNLNVGFKPVIIVLGEPTDSLHLKKFISSASTVIFSSEKMTHVPKIMDELLSSTIELIDLKWIALSGWRAQLRNLSLRYNLIELEQRLQRITLRSASPFSSETKLTAGWILKQLKSSILSYGKNGFECFSEQSGRSWQLILTEIDDSLNSGLLGIELLFAPHDDYPDGVRIDISLIEGKDPDKTPRFDTSFISGRKELHFTGAKGKGDDLESLKRYFTSGESVAMYRDSSLEGELLKQLCTRG